MPDTPVERPAGPPYPSDLESRVARLEGEMTGLRADLSGIRADIAGINGKLESMNGKLEYIRGHLEHVPITWAMVTAIVGGQVALAGLLTAAILGATRIVSGHG
jgi:hypothetical protein